MLQGWDNLATPEGGTDSKLELLKIFAEITEHCGELENPQQKIDAVYALLMVCQILLRHGERLLSFKPFF